jgi:hypothetical protein
MKERLKIMAASAITGLLIIICIAHYTDHSDDAKATMIAKCAAQGVLVDDKSTNVICENNTANGR